MDAFSVNSLSGTAAADAGAALAPAPLSFDDLLNASDEQLMVLASKGNTQAILELEKRDAVRASRLPASAAKNPTASATTLDAPGILGLEEPDAAQAAKLLATADETVSGAAEDTVGNIVDKFV
jgi:hypothetical protein